MESRVLIDGLIMYLCFIPILTLHEFAHAWMAWKCGDDTARMQGRVTLNPISHIDPVGTVALPLFSILLTAGGGGGIARFLIGWGRPVPVDPGRLRRRRLDGTLVAMAGPLMNILLSMALIAVCRFAGLANLPMVVDVCSQIALLSLFLCFFNLLPIPPLDGSHLLKNAIGMREETFAYLSQFGFVAVIILVNLSVVRNLLGWLTGTTFTLMASMVGL